MLIWDSYRISDPYEMEAIIEVMMTSELYDPKIFTHSALEYFNEWQAHTYAYEVFSRGHQTFFDLSVLEKSRSVDFHASDSKLFWRIF